MRSAGRCSKSTDAGRVEEEGSALSRKRSTGVKLESTIGISSRNKVD